MGMYKKIMDDFTERYGSMRTINESFDKLPPGAKLTPTQIKLLDPRVNNVGSMSEWVKVQGSLKWANVEPTKQTYSGEKTIVMLGVMSQESVVVVYDGSAFRFAFADDKNPTWSGKTFKELMLNLEKRSSSIGAIFNPQWYYAVGQKDIKTSKQVSSHTKMRGKSPNEIKAVRLEIMIPTEKLQGMVVKTIETIGNMIQTLVAKTFDPKRFLNSIEQARSAWLIVSDLRAKVYDKEQWPSEEEREKAEEEYYRLRGNINNMVKDIREDVKRLRAWAGELDSEMSKLESFSLDDEAIEKKTKDLFLKLSKAKRELENPNSWTNRL